MIKMKSDILPIYFVNVEEKIAQGGEEELWLGWNDTVRKF
jgi:hypothetical protein